MQLTDFLFATGRNTLAISLLAVAISPAAAQEALAHSDEHGVTEAEDGKSPTSEAPLVTDMPEILVYGRAEKRIGTAAAASEGGVAGADIEIRPLLRPGELLEATPGMIATQHSGGGKANQYFLRGFNLDHGTDYALYIDDMPMNFRTHGHGQGYLDVNGLIPEIVQRVDYRKGPYRADTGDFSFVGSSFITTKDEIQPFAVGEVGMYDYYRVVSGGTVKLGSANLTFAGQAKFNDGPWELPEKYRGYSAFAKYSAPLGMGDFQVAFNGFWAKWAPTEQTPERVIGTPLCEDAFCSLDKTLRGRTERELLTANYTDMDWKLTAWIQHYDWSLLNNFTFYLDDPVNGDQRRQYDRLWGYGGRIERTVKLSEKLSLRAGTELRADDIGEVGLDHTIAGKTDFTYLAFKVHEQSAGIYAEATWKPFAGLMIIGGGRGDFYRFKTSPAGGASWGDTVKDSLFAPKIGANYEVAPGIALYANYGEGFHSNDARGVTNPVDPAPGLVKGNFKEIGGRFERGGMILTGVYWWSAIDSELIYVGDSGAVEPSDPGKRQGYELTAFWKPNDWLAIDGVWTGSRGHYVGLPKGANRIPGALDSAGELGISALFPEWNSAVRFRYLGGHPLVEDNSVRGEATLLVNLRLAWTPKRLHGFEVYGELLNALDSDKHDIDYFYETRFPGEPADGVLDLNSRIVEPRQVRIGIKKTF